MNFGVLAFVMLALITVGILRLVQPRGWIVCAIGAVLVAVDVGLWNQVLNHSDLFESFGGDYDHDEVLANLAILILAVVVGIAGWKPSLWLVPASPSRTDR